MNDLSPQALKKLAKANPELRPIILPLLKKKNAGNLSDSTELKILNLKPSTKDGDFLLKGRLCLGSDVGEKSFSGILTINTSKVSFTLSPKEKSASNWLNPILQKIFSVNHSQLFKLAMKVS